MRARRVAKVMLAGLMAVVALAALAVGTAVTFARTERGGRWLLGAIVPRINQQIAGHLTAASLRLDGWRLSLAGVTLRAPEGEVVAEIETIEVTAAPLALLRRRLVLKSVVIDRPSLRMVLDHAGLDLERAIAPRVPPAPEAAREPGRLSVSLDALAVRGGRVELRVKLPDVRRHVRVHDIELAGAAHYQARDARLSADLHGTARAQAPFPAPVTLDLHARGAGETGEAKVSLDVGETAVRLSLAAAGRTALDLTIERLALDPRLVRALAPAAPGPAAPVVMTGHVRRAGPTVTADLSLRAGRGRIHLEGAADPAAAVLRRLRVTGSGMDLAALLHEGPRSEIDFTLDAHGRGRDLRSLRGEVRLEVPPARLGAARTGPVRVHARADAEGYELVDLVAALPGLSLSAHGRGTGSALDFEGTLVARDLEATVGALEGPGPKRLPAVAGSGALRLAVKGPVAAPRLEARGRFPRLRFEANRADGLEVAVDIADLRRPQRADVRVRAARVQAGERSLRDVRLALASDRPQAFAASASVAAPALALRSTGRWSADFETLTVDELRLVHPEAEWRLERPARLHFGDGFSLENLALTSGAQRIAASVQATPRRLAGTVTIAKLDLARLPQALLPPSLHLTGVVDLDAELAGSPTRPRGRARLSIEDGRFQRLEKVTVKVDARHDGRRVVGTLAGTSNRASLSARFDLPAVWPPPDGAPVSLELDVAPFDIPALLASVGTRPPPAVRGQASLRATINGTFAHPQVSVDAQVRRLAVRGETLGDATLALAIAAPAAGLDTKLSLRAFGGSASLEARAPLTVAQLFRQPPRSLMRTPITITGAADRLPLRPLARLAGNDQLTAGTLTMRLAARGTAQAPAGEAKVRVDAVAGPRFPATDATVDLSAHETNGPRIAARLSRKGQVLATIDAALSLATARLADLNALVSAPLEVKAHLGPLRIKQNGLPAATDRDRTGAISALVDAKLEVGGTLRAPRLTLSAKAEDARLDQRPLGRGDLLVRYANARPELAMNVATANGGVLHLTGSAALELGYPRVLRPIDVRMVPITAQLESKQLDLGALSGLAETVRTVGGTLTANARVRGKVGAPQVEGRLEWKDGKLVVAGLGNYHDIHLLVLGDADQVVLEELSVQAGQGNGKITGRASREGARGFRVTTQAKLKRFPLYAQGQPLATLSLDASASGTAAPELVNLTAKITEARVVLAEGKRKKLQPLDRPADVVLLDHGQPLNRDQARKLERLVAQRRAPGTPALADTGTGPQTRRFRLEVEAPRNLWIEGPDVEIELGLAEGFMVNVASEPRVFGTVLVRRGRVEVIGRRFDVDDTSIVRFTGPPEIPTLAVKATYQVRKAALSVRVALDGPVDDLDLQLSSPDNPQLGDTELLTVVATGHLPDERTSGAVTPSTQAVSLVGAVLAGKLQDSLSKRLPLDVLSIEPGQGLSSTRLEAGTYLTDSVYVAYVGRVGADPFRRENRNEVQLEYQLSRRWSFEGIYGDARIGSVDLVWTKNY